MTYILHFVQDRLWDNNGNLLSDGVNTYTYDHANRLVSVVGSATTSSFGYNGLGDRLQQTVDSVTESYTLDLNNGLTQVLADGTNTYLYGNGRIAQYNGSGAEYFLGDALGSVRQLADGSGALTLVKSYQPFGNVMQSVGTGSSPYGFTNEWTDGNGLVYLRSRYYSPGNGRFITKDPWQGDIMYPRSFNNWLYAFVDPVNKADPSGSSPFFPPPCLISNSQDCVNIARWQFSKEGPIWLAGKIWGGRFDCSNSAWSKPNNARELLADYICERGPVGVRFSGKDVVTKELAYARMIDRLRKRFYREGDIPKHGEPTEFRFNLPQYGKSITDILISGQPLPIMHFIGSFDYSVAKTNNNRVMYLVENQTDLASGTHIPGRWPPESQKGNSLTLEEVIENSPVLKFMPATLVIATFHDKEGNQIVSLLEPRTRTETKGLGGGSMIQTFTWTEQYLTCGLERKRWPEVLDFIDVR